MGYEVDLRTVQRDLVKLSGSETFQIISDGSKPAGWSWKPNAATLDIPSIDPQTALVFHLVEEHSLERNRGPRTWQAWLWFHPRLVSDMLNLLIHVKPLYVTLHERKAGRDRCVQSLSLQTIKPDEE